MAGVFKAVFLDIGGTILANGEPPHQVYQDILHQHGYPGTLDQTKQWLDEARTEARATPFGPSADFTISDDRQKAYRGRMVESFLDRAGVERDFDACYEEIHRSWIGTRIFHLYPDAAKALAELKNAGLIVGAVSNWESRLDRLLSSHGILQFFDFVLASEAQGYSKPSRRLYELALERAGVRAEEALHVGDSEEEDLKAAESTGIRAVYIQRRPDRLLRHAPRIASLEPLPALATCQALLRGYVQTGRGEGAGYTNLDWVREQVRERLGFDLYPGTLNLRLEDERDRVDWVRLRAEPGVSLEPTPDYCAARCYPAWLEGSLPCAVVLPMVSEYPGDVVEVIAPIPLRRNLGLQDGWPVSLAMLQVGGGADFAI